METFSLPEHLTHSLEVLLYFAQALTYGAAFWACRRRGHSTYPTYLASCAIHIALGAMALLSIY